MIYVASPYSHPDPAVMQQRFEIACDFTARGIRRGFHMISPITYGHPIKTRHGLPDDPMIWMPLDIAILRRSEVMYIVCMPGWEESTGVTLERKIADTLQIPQAHYKPDGDKFLLQDDHWRGNLPEWF